MSARRMILSGATLAILVSFTQVQGQTDDSTPLFPPLPTGTDSTPTASATMTMTSDVTPEQLVELKNELKGLTDRLAAVEKSSEGPSAQEVADLGNDLTALSQKVESMSYDGSVNMAVQGTWIEFLSARLELLDATAQASAVAQAESESPSDANACAALVVPSEEPELPDGVTDGAQNLYDLTPQAVFGQEVEELQVMNDHGYSVRGRIVCGDKDRNVLWYFTKEGEDAASSLDADGDGVIDNNYPSDIRQRMCVVIFDFLPQDGYLVAEVRTPKEGRETLVRIGQARFKRGTFGGWQALIDAESDQVTQVKCLMRRACEDMRKARFHPRVSTVGRNVDRVTFTEKALLESFVRRFGVVDAPKEK